MKGLNKVRRGRKGGKEEGKKHEAGLCGEAGWSLSNNFLLVLPKLANKNTLKFEFKINN